jgi:threonine efflux protein
MPSETIALAGFAAVMALGQFSPGPDMLWLTRVSLREGRRTGVITALGIACGLAVHATLALTGLAILLNQNDSLRIAFTLAAAAYLAWLASRIMCERPSVPNDEETRPISNPFLRGLLCNLANPKVAILLAAICVPFLESKATWMPLVLWSIIVIQGGVLWALWACLLQVAPIRRCYQHQAGRIDIAFAVTLFGIALWLVASALI